MNLNTQFQNNNLIKCSLLSTSSGLEDHSLINETIVKDIQKGKLPSSALINYAVQWFNLYNDPKFQFQPTLAVKWQLYFAAHTERNADGTIHLGPNFNYTYLNGEDLATLYRILNAYQIYEKEVSQENAVFPTIVHYLEEYLVNLCVTDEVKLRDVLSALLAFQNPKLYIYPDQNLSNIMRRMRDAIVSNMSGRKERNENQGIIALPKELLKIIVEFVGDPKLTIRICKVFKEATLNATLTFLRPFKDVQIIHVQEKMALAVGESPEARVERLGRHCDPTCIPPANETQEEAYERFRQIFNTFMLISQRMIPQGQMPVPVVVNPSIVSPTSALNRISMIEKTRREYADVHLIEFCKKLPIPIQLSLYAHPLNINFQNIVQPEQNNFHPIVRQIQEHNPGWPRGTFVVLNHFVTNFLQNFEENVASFDSGHPVTISLASFRAGTLIDPPATEEELVISLLLFLMINNTFIIELNLRMQEEEQIERSSGYFKTLDNTQKAQHIRNQLQNNELLSSLTTISSQNFFGISVIPPEIKHFWNMASVKLNDRNVIFLPREIGELRNLVQLDVSSSGISSIGHGIKQIQSLESLNIARTPIRELTGHVIKNLTKLKWLYLNETPIASLPAELGDLQELTHLDISRTRITSLPLEIFTRMPNLQTIRAHQCNIPEEQIAALKAAKPGLVIHNKMIPNEHGYLYEP